MRGYGPNDYCLVDGCSKPMKARSLCIYHYNLFLVRGYPLPAKMKTHGHTKNHSASPEYISWANMLSRCLYPKNNQYSSYGGRGIAVCERWKVFDNFLADMGMKPSPEHTLERIDNNKGYAPDNCRWATMYEQRRNTRRNHWLIVNGERIIITDAALKYGVHVTTIRSRLYRGIQEELAVGIGG